MTDTATALNFRVVVRRMMPGAAPYGWEVHQDDAHVPLHVSADRFRGMEAAYRAGQAWLAEFVRSQPRHPARSEGAAGLFKRERTRSGVVG